MHQLTLSFLGGYTATLDGVPLTRFRSNKMRALLVYLAVETDYAHTRSHLMGLLWPEMPEERAAVNLRQTLSRLRQLLNDRAVDTPFILATRHEVRFNLTSNAALDVWLFKRSIEAQTPTAIAKAVALYQGEFLMGFTLAGCEEFESWLFLKREQYLLQMLESLSALTTMHLGETNFAKAQEYARRQLELDPLREPAHRQLMQALAYSGQRNAALAQFATCRQLLWNELAIEPETATTQLFEELRNGELISPPKLDLPSNSNSLILPPSRPLPALMSRRELALFPPDATAPETTPAFEPKVDWGDAPVLDYFYGRQAELQQLEQWVVDERCRMVFILGMGGQGKTTLAAHFAAAQIQQPLVQTGFTHLLWCSLLNAPQLAEILHSWLTHLSDPPMSQPTATVEEQMGLLIDLLRQQRCLLILDNVESIMQSGERAGHYRPGYEEYARLMQRLAVSDHQSCLLLTSRERPEGIQRTARQNRQIHTLTLAGLDSEAGRNILHEFGFTGPAEAEQALIERYSGNPLALMLVADTVQEFFAGDATLFLRDETPIFDDIRAVLDQQFARLLPLELSVIFWLVVEREAISIDDLSSNFVHPPAKRDLLEALRSLERRSLLTRVQAKFTLQNVIMEYATRRLNEAVCQELMAEELALFASHSLIKAQSKDYVRAMQTRLLLDPIATWLQHHFTQGEFRIRFEALLNKLRTSDHAQAGYAGGNILNILLHIGVDLRGMDFSQLPIWQANLRNHTLPHVNLTRADFRHTVFQDTFRAVHSLEISPDGQYLVAGTGDTAVYVWRVADGQLVKTYTGHTLLIWKVAISPDGQLLASGSADQTVCVWHIASGQLLYQLHAHTEFVVGLAFSPDARLLASGGFDNRIHLWDLQDGRLVQTLSGHKIGCKALAFCSDGKHLVSGGCEDGALVVWALEEGVQLRRINDADGINAVAFSPDGQLLAVACYEETVVIWDTVQWEVIYRLQGHTGPVKSIAFHPSGTLLASGSQDTTVRLWDVQTGRARQVLMGHDSWVESVTFTPDGATLITGSNDQTIRVWDVETMQIHQTFSGYNRWVESFDFNGDGSLLASGGWDGLVHVWDTANGEVVKTLPKGNDWIVAVQFSPDGIRLADASNAGAIRLWDATTTELLDQLPVQSKSLRCVRFNHDGTHLAYGGGDGSVRVWNLAKRQEVARLEGHVPWIEDLIFMSDGVHLISAGAQTIRIWAWAVGECVQILRGHIGALWGLALHDDEHTLASGGKDGVIKLWDLRNGENIGNLKGHTQTVRALAFRPNTTILASTGEDQTIRLWDIEHGQLIGELAGHTGDIVHLAFHPDGHTLVSGSNDDTLRYWNVETKECLRVQQIPGPYEGMLITDATGLTAAQKETLRALGAVTTTSGSSLFRTARNPALK